MLPHPSLALVWTFLIGPNWAILISDMMRFISLGMKYGKAAVHGLWWNMLLHKVKSYERYTYIFHFDSVTTQSYYYYEISWNIWLWLYKIQPYKHNDSQVFLVISVKKVELMIVNKYFGHLYSLIVSDIFHGFAYKTSPFVIDCELLFFFCDLFSLVGFTMDVFIKIDLCVLHIGFMKDM